MASFISSVDLFISGTKNSPSGMHVNVNGIKGHYITKEIEIHQDHSNTRHYTPSISSIGTSTSFPIIKYDNFDNRESSKRDYDYTHTDSHLRNEFNPNKQWWKPIKYHNTTQDSNVLRYFNQSHAIWKPQNNTTFNPSDSTEPISNHDTNIARDYNVRHDESTTASTMSRKKNRSKGGITLWEKPDTNVPFVSIDETEYDGNDSDEDVALPDEEKIYNINNKHAVSKFDVDVLDKSDKWKPRFADEKKINKKDEDRSVIMTINKKINDLDHFNVESAPWQEGK